MATPTQLQLDIALAGLARPPRRFQRLDALRTIADALQAAAAAWQRRARAAESYHVLASLDTRTLRDLGFDRSELASVAAELAGEAAPTRVRTIRARLPVMARGRCPA